MSVNPSLGADSLRPSGGRAVMESRRDPVDSLDFFPTPPWATRALCECAIQLPHFYRLSAWDPAAGQGHMSDVLSEYFDPVFASDVHDYGRGHLIGSFVGEGVDVIPAVEADWIITNPPFNLALQFVERALKLARIGVAMLVRTAWLEGGERHDKLFTVRPPTRVALFAERVPMVKGRWDPKASTATSYAWVTWRQDATGETKLTWIPPGCRTALSKPDDVARFAEREAA